MRAQSFRKTVFIAILVALGVVFSYFDGLVANMVLATMPFIAMINPYFKFGFSNVVIMLFVLNFTWRDGFFAIFLKSLIVGLIFGRSGLTTFALSMSGSFLSFVVMKSLVKSFANRTVFISVIGGFMHALGQIIMSFFVFQIEDLRVLLVHSPALLITGGITGFLVGLISKKTNASVKKHLQTV